MGIALKTFLLERSQAKFIAGWNSRPFRCFGDDTQLSPQPLPSSLRSLIVTSSKYAVADFCLSFKGYPTLELAVQSDGERSPEADPRCREEAANDYQADAKPEIFEFAFSQI